MAQLAEINSVIRKQNCYSLLVGDFNFDDERNFNKHDSRPTEESLWQQQLPDFVDVWRQLKQDAGKTFDTSRNVNLDNHRSQVMRYDRIVAGPHSNVEWKPASIEMIDEPFESNGTLLHHSDHFGLIASFIS